jgi:hypothetical protein
MHDVWMTDIAKQSMDSGQSGKARWSVQHDLPTLPFPTGDGDPHASILPLLHQSVATAPELAGCAPATTNNIQLQVPQTLVDDHDIDAGDVQRQPTDDPEMYIHHLESLERAL